MCGCNLLKFLNSHVRHKKGRKMTINLQRRRVSRKKIEGTTKKIKAKMGTMKLKNMVREHLMKEIFAIILVSNGDILFEVTRANGLDKSFLGFLHSVPNFKSRSTILGSSFMVKPCRRVSRIRNFSLWSGGMRTMGGHEHRG